MCTIFMFLHAAIHYSMWTDLTSIYIYLVWLISMFRNMYPYIIFTERHVVCSQAFTADGIYSVPPVAKSLQVLLVGGGGGLFIPVAFLFGSLIWL